RPKAAQAGPDHASPSKMRSRRSPAVAAVRSGSVTARIIAAPKRRSSPQPGSRSTSAPTIRAAARSVTVSTSSAGPVHCLLDRNSERAFAVSIALSYLPDKRVDDYEAHAELVEFFSPL